MLILANLQAFRWGNKTNTVKTSHALRVTKILREKLLFLFFDFS